MKKVGSNLENIYSEMHRHLREGIIPFWDKICIDEQMGGYFTTVDSSGNIDREVSKNLVTQSRLIWGYAALYNIYKEKEFLDKARYGLTFFIENFWDKKNEGWYWDVARDGTPIDKGKIVYGQSFAVYALSELAVASGNGVCEYAEKTFDLIQKYAADTANGGYYEYMEEDWSPSKPGVWGGDRKTLDTHMHLLEAFTNLYRCTGKMIHMKKLLEVIELVTKKMVDNLHGFGMNHFDREFNSVPAISIRRTWNADREAGQEIEEPTETTSYGHNLELVWLINRAYEVLGISNAGFRDLARKLTDYSIKNGYDNEYGGVYRDGVFNGAAIVLDKEWWQNCESLVGFLDAYENYRDEKYLEVFTGTWEFAKKYFIDPVQGEWRQLLDRTGNILIGDIGNPWKVFYHSGRSIMECLLRLERILDK